MTEYNQDFFKYGILLPADCSDEAIVSCPNCAIDHPEGTTTLSVHASLGVWHCQHCAWRGKLDIGTSSVNPWLFSEPVLPIYNPKPLSKAGEAWFTKRGLSLNGANHFGFGLMTAWNSKKKVLADAITVPYKMDGAIINIKHRFGKLNGNSFVLGADVIPFGMDDIQENCTIICASEIDALYFYEIGVHNVIALPHGVPAIAFAKNGTAPNLQTLHDSLAFLENHGARLAGIKKIILCIGGDKSSELVTEELARRLGRERCWPVVWPEDKRSVDSVFQSGHNRLEYLIESAKAYPVKGVFELSDVKTQFDSLYERGLPPGPNPGWVSMDEFYRPALGQWTLVTGIPSHGKSNFLDALLCNLANMHDWKFCFFSPENQPVARHFANLAEKFIGAPFHQKNGHKARMTIEQKESAETWLNNHFSVVLPDEEDGNWTIDGVLELAKTVISRKGIQGIVIDPWNELDHTRPAGMTETEHVSKVISKIRQFARTHSVHIWLVAHPTKMYKGDDGQYPIPTPYDVAGSAHFLNKADMAICVYRYVGQVDQTITDVYIQKMRFKENGQVGRVSLRYTPDTGQFIDDIDQPARSAALTSKTVKPTDAFIRSDKIKKPEFNSNT
jgi:twinkle protein